MALKTDLTSLLTERDSPIRAPVLRLESVSGGKVAGFVISPTFRRMRQINRQNLVWDFLEEKLPRDKVLRIVSLITLTPEEADVGK
jgi:acid stress-induced BolA-like protein IbaG/YrbA